MTVSFSLEKEKVTAMIHTHLLQKLLLRYKQATYLHSRFICTYSLLRPVTKKLQETIGYADEQPRFSQQEIAYLRSEAWLTDFPHVWNVHEF
ncbi:histidine kinase, partial [Nostoc sp. 'Peltigera malacea cyanobiont' DB3992]